MSKITACSFDGAANMKGAYNGLKAHMTKDNPNLIYTHCMDHVLNLVIADSTKSCLLAENLYGLVEETAVLISNSHKRMDIWKEQTGEQHKAHAKLYCIQKIGETRWWSKHKALASIIDPEDFSESSKFCNFLLFLTEVISGSFDSKTKFMARTLLEKWTQFQKLLTAMIILDLFSITSPVSKFLQSHALDYLKAWRCVESLLQLISDKRNENHYDKLYQRCKVFAKKVNSIFIDNPLVELQEDFELKRISIKKKTFGELSHDETSKLIPFQKTKVIYFQILDTIKFSISDRFVPNQDLLLDISWLDPVRYKEITLLSIEEFPLNALNKLSELAGVDRKTLFVELKQFAEQYQNFSTSWRSVYRETNDITEDLTLGDSEKEDDQSHLKQQECNNCLPNVFKIIFELTTKSGLFNTLYISFKYVLILPCTQVKCERVFSKLKILKNKLRLLISQQYLDPLTCLFVEEDLIEFINKDEAINILGSSSNELKNLPF